MLLQYQKVMSHSNIVVLQYPKASFLPYPVSLMFAAIEQATYFPAQLN